MKFHPSSFILHPCRGIPLLPRNCDGYESRSYQPLSVCKDEGGGRLVLTGRRGE